LLVGFAGGFRGSELSTLASKAFKIAADVGLASCRFGAHNLRSGLAMQAAQRDQLARDHAADAPQIRADGKAVHPPRLSVHRQRRG
jgi:hypothetical protein